MPANSESINKPERHSVAVVLAGGTNGLGVVRGLHAKGIGAIVACKSRYDASFLSRLPVRKVLIPDEVSLADWLPGFAKSVAGLADCIIPTSDEFASAMRNLIESPCESLPCILPPEDLVDVLNDKRSEIQLVQKIGVPLPASFVDLRELASADPQRRFPMIIKPRTYEGFDLLGAKNRIVGDQGELDRFLQEFAADLDGFIAQEIILGDEQGQWVCNATFDHRSEMVSAFSFQRLGTIPYLYGVTTFAASRHNTEVKSLCSRIGRALKYTGPAMFEFKVDPRSGHYCYIETNPRLGMCNWFDTRCGVNNVFNTYALSVGIEPEANTDRQADGAMYLNLVFDLVARIRAGRSLRSFVTLYTSHFPRNVTRPAWYWRDPLPVIAHPLGIAVGRWKKRSGRERDHTRAA